MARAPQTGFYFEPIAERLALVVEGRTFPSDDHWAWLGDPIEISPEQARLEVAARWPGVDPDALEVEYDLDFEAAAADAERERLQALAGLARLPREFDLDLARVLEQAEILREAARQMALRETTPEALELAAEQQLAQEMARGLAEPAGPGTVLRSALEGRAPAGAVRDDQGTGPGPGEDR